MLTLPVLHSLLSYNRRTGEFRWLVDRGGGIKAGDKAGTTDKQDGYVRIRVLGKKYKAHRLAWFYVTGDWPSEDIDHRDGVRSNNRWHNLRDTTTQTNVQNSSIRKDNSTGFTGVKRTRSGTYEARIRHDGWLRTIGTFPTPEQAHRAYTAAKKLLHSGAPVQRPNHTQGSNPKGGI